jgi:hypothetical protein
MANILRLKRRFIGASGTTNLTLVNGEVAFSEIDSILYYGKATNGNPGVVSIIPIAGDGHFITLSTNQSVSGQKTFTGTTTFTSNVDLGSSVVAATPTSSDNSTKVATTAFVKAQGYTANTGTLTSVGLDGITNFITTGSTPVTGSSGTITMALVSQTANKVLASPNGSSGTPTFRALVASDIPDLSATYMPAAGNITVGGNLTVTGDFTVNGTTTNINTTNMVVEDKNIVLGDTASPTDATADEGGITLIGSSNKQFIWKNNTDAWTSTEHLDLNSAGSSRYLLLAGNRILGPQDLTLISIGTFFELDKVVMDGGTY